MSRQEELSFEEKIKEAKCEAPRLNPKKIDDLIKDVRYTLLSSGKAMICEMTLKNGFLVTGLAHVVSRENFVEKLGQEKSYNDARSKIWELEAYLLQQKLYEGGNID